MSNILSPLKKFIFLLERTIFHPQYIAKKYAVYRYKFASTWAQGLIADIGCGRQALRKYLVRPNRYIGLDYPLTNERYEVCPDVFADAEKLPFPDSCLDTIVLLEVAEHIPDVRLMISEVSRVLKPGGRFVFSAPFLYPIHDAPQDFARYTEYGLTSLFELQSFVVQKMDSLGSPAESTVLQINLVLAWYALNSHLAFRPIFLLLVVIVCPVSNLITCIFRSVFPRSLERSPFPIGYVVALERCG